MDPHRKHWILQSWNITELKNLEVLSIKIHRLDTDLDAMSPFNWTLSPEEISSRIPLSSGATLASEKLTQAAAMVFQSTSQTGNLKRRRNKWALKDID
jgi:hypothetical protein